MDRCCIWAKRRSFSAHDCCSSCCISAACLFIVKIVFLLAVAASSTTAAAKCVVGQPSTSGIIQLSELSSCPPLLADSNGLLGLCGPAFKVDVNSQGAIFFTPIEQGIFTWAGPIAGTGGTQFQCKNMNATGQFDAYNSKDALVMFYKDVRGPHSRLTVTGANELTLVPAHIDFPPDVPPVSKCALKYKVVSGCVMGITASKAATCKPGWSVKKGNFGARYCAPCPPGSSTKKANSGTCTKCAKGTFNAVYGGKCQTCPGSNYTTAAGSTSCPGSCDVSGWLLKKGTKPVYLVSHKVGCARCPPDSWASEQHPTQCSACNKGKRCCRTNPSPSCPPCPKGFKSSASKVTATFSLESAKPAKCYGSPAAMCTTSFKLTVERTCQVRATPASPLLSQIPDQRPGCLSGENKGFVKGARAAPGDVSPFGPDTVIKRTTIKGPQVTFSTNLFFLYELTNQGQGTACTFTYRAVTSSATLLGVTPAKCPVGKPGCITKAKPPTCPKGTYVGSNTDGKTLCLKCPPGTINPSTTTATSCKSCPAGSFASGYGNTACKKCDAGSYSPKPGGFALCLPCGGVFPPQGSTALGFYTATKGATSCKPCPTYAFPERVDPTLSPYKATRCLGVVDGNVCCAAGNCSGQTKCPSGSLSPYLEPQGGAILKLETTKLTDRLCRRALLLTCLKPGSRIYGKQSYNVDVTAFGGFAEPACFDRIRNVAAQVVARASSTTLARAEVASPSDSSDFFIYQIFTSKSKGTLTMTFSPSSYTLTARAAVKCSATFSIEAGAVMDLSGPPGAKCPPGSLPITAASGRTSCRPCPPGSYQAATQCVMCSAGTYAPVAGLTKCSPCPTADNGSPVCPTCGFGEGLMGVGKKLCGMCPKNTFGGDGTVNSPAAPCQACPPGTVAPGGSAACGVAFPPVASPEPAPA